MMNTIMSLGHSRWMKKTIPLKSVAQSLASSLAVGSPPAERLMARSSSSSSSTSSSSSPSLRSARSAASASASSSTSPSPICASLSPSVASLDSVSFACALFFLAPPA